MPSQHVVVHTHCPRELKVVEVLEVQAAYTAPANRVIAARTSRTRLFFTVSSLDGLPLRCYSNISFVKLWLGVRPEAGPLRWHAEGNDAGSCR